MQCLAGPLLHRWQDQQNPGDEPKDLSAPDRNQTALLQHLAWGLGGINHQGEKLCRTVPQKPARTPFKGAIQS